ncbi:MAG: MarR family winged helix-turn-helix transcriptional regulator [Lachnospirales bacterium]
MRGYKEKITKDLSILSNKMRRKLDGLTVKDDCTSSQGRLLFFLLANNHRDIYQKNIEDEYGLRPSSASELLKKMEEKGLIRRESKSYDARLKKIIVTDKALSHEDSVVSECIKLEDKLLRGVSHEEMKIFSEIITRMIKNLA